jgi:hypothetical protein
VACDVDGSITRDAYTAHVPRSSVDRGGFLLVRLWMGEGDGFRARLTYRPDAATHEEVASAATVEQVCDVVRAWVDAFQLGDKPPGS